MKKKIFINVLVILAIVISINFNMTIKAAGNEFVGQSDGKVTILENKNRTSLQSRIRSCI